MTRLAVSAGHTLIGSPFAANAQRVEVETLHGRVDLLDAGSYLVLQRHGLNRYRAPHAIDHRANLAALAESGIDRILGVLLDRIPARGDHSGILAGAG